MNREQLIERTHKLMQMANSETANPQEAAIATAKAQALITQYNIEQAELEAAGQPADPIESHYVAWPDPNNLDAWEKQLVTEVANAFFCTTVYWKDRVAFIGRTTDAGVAQFVWQFVRSQFLDQIKTAAKVEAAKNKKYGWTVNMKKWRRDWLLGAVAGVAEQLRVRHTSMSADRFGTALIISREGEIENYMVKKFPSIRRVKARRINVGMAYFDGQEAGRKAQVETGFSEDPLPTRKQLKEA